MAIEGGAATPYPNQPLRGARKNSPLPHKGEEEGGAQPALTLRMRKAGMVASVKPR